MVPKKTQGRKKIEIKKIPNESSKQVTFSKRRKGLFNKASEVCVLTGAEAAIIVQSPGNRVFAFGHPSVDSVVDHYLDAEKSQVNEVVDLNSTCMNDKFNQHYLEINKELDYEKSKTSVIENKVQEDGRFWWEQSFEDLGLEELEKYIVSMEELKNKITDKANELMLIRTSSMFEAHQISKNNVDTFMVNENINAGCGDDHTVPCPRGFNFQSDKK